MLVMMLVLNLHLIYFRYVGTSCTTNQQKNANTQTFNNKTMSSNFNE